MITSQEVFDHTVRALYEQGGPSMDHGRCAYRGDENRRCAVGVWIHPDRYSPSLEGTPLGGEPGTVVFLSLLTEARNHIPLLVSLQNAHDGAEDWSNVWSLDGIATLLSQVARRHRLESTKVQELWKK